MSGAEFKHAHTAMLRTALAHGREKQYHTDPTFHSCIDTLAGMMVPMIAGLGNACTEEAAAMAKAVAEAISAGMPRARDFDLNSLRKDTPT